MTAAVGFLGELPVEISRRMVRLLSFNESMPRVPFFEAADSWRGRDGVAVPMMLLWCQGGSLSAIQDAMVIMTF